MQERPHRHVLHMPDSRIIATSAFISGRAATPGWESPSASQSTFTRAGGRVVAPCRWRTAVPATCSPTISRTVTLRQWRTSCGGCATTSGRRIPVVPVGAPARQDAAAPLLQCRVVQDGSHLSGGDDALARLEACGVKGYVKTGLHICYEAHQVLAERLLKRVGRSFLRRLGRGERCGKECVLRMNFVGKVLKEAASSTGDGVFKGLRRPHPVNGNKKERRLAQDIHIIVAPRCAIEQVPDEKILVAYRFDENGALLLVLLVHSSVRAKAVVPLPMRAIDGAHAPRDPRLSVSLNNDGELVIIGAVHVDR